MSKIQDFCALDPHPKNLIKDHSQVVAQMDGVS